MRLERARPTAFGQELCAQRRQRRLTPDRFAELCGVSLSALKQWEYGWRGLSAKRAAKLARKLSLPPWHFEQALARDRLESICRVGEVTAVVVGLEQYLAVRLPGEQWAEVRAMVLKGA